MAFVHHLLLLLLPSLVFAQNNGTIPIGSSLTAGDPSASPWRSPSGDFAFGFQELGNDLFLLSIWFSKLPDKSIVWYPRDSNTVPRGSKISLTASDGLLLQTPQGAKLWSSNGVSGAVRFGRMNDTGNFLVLDSNSEAVWESFTDPRDTLLPNQAIDATRSLFSRKSEKNFSQGRFQFQLLSGGAVLNIVNLPTLHEYDQYYSKEATDGNNIVFDNEGFLYITRRNGSRVTISEPAAAYPAETYYYKLALDFDGVLTVSHRPKNPSNNELWTDFFKVPDNICTAMRGTLSSGVCGYNSICTLTNDQRASCKCPPGYSLIDPNDEFGSCKPDIPQICEEGAGNDSNLLYYMEKLPNTDWPMLDYELYDPFDEESCRNACLADCICVVSVYRGSQCWKKKLPLSNGREDRTESSVSYLKLVRNRNTTSTGPNYPDFPLPESKNKVKQDRLVTVISVLLGSSVLVILLMGSFICLGCFFHRKKVAGDSTRRESTNLRRFTHKELTEATNGFNEELGRGSCGIVFKGEIETGALVAVKILDRVFEETEKEFKTEVNAIGRTHHKNLVQLLGFCDEGRNRILVYEFMSNGTLSSLLFGDTRPSWKLRAEIGVGIARGLAYLHEECSVQIIHCDIKPQNILLDEDHGAKIADFGLAKLLKLGQSRTDTGIRGTKGYVAPDWFRRGPVSPKVDVYSFGVLVLEIISCRRNNDNGDVEGGGDRERRILVDWAYDCMEEGRLERLVEEGDEEAMEDMGRLERFVRAAIWCVQEDPSLRPTMKMVVLMLEGLVQVSAPPSPCPFTFTS